MSGSILQEAPGPRRIHLFSSHAWFGSLTEPISHVNVWDPMPRAILSGHRWCSFTVEQQDLLQAQMQVYPWAGAMCMACGRVRCGFGLSCSGITFSSLSCSCDMCLSAEERDWDDAASKDMSVLLACTDSVLAQVLLARGSGWAEPSVPLKPGVIAAEVSPCWAWYFEMLV